MYRITRFLGLFLLCTLPFSAYADTRGKLPNDLLISKKVIDQIPVALRSPTLASVNELFALQLHKDFEVAQVNRKNEVAPDGSTVKINNIGSDLLSYSYTSVSGFLVQFQNQTLEISKNNFKYTKNQSTETYSWPDFLIRKTIILQPLLESIQYQNHDEKQKLEVTFFNPLTSDFKQITLHNFVITYGSKWKNFVQLLKDWKDWDLVLSTFQNIFGYPIDTPYSLVMLNDRGETSPFFGKTFANDPGTRAFAQGQSFQVVAWDSYADEKANSLSNDFYRMYMHSIFHELAHNAQDRFSNSINPDYGTKHLIPVALKEMMAEFVPLLVFKGSLASKLKTLYNNALKGGGFNKTGTRPWVYFEGALSIFALYKQYGPEKMRELSLAANYTPISGESIDHIYALNKVFGLNLTLAMDQMIDYFQKNRVQYESMIPMLEAADLLVVEPQNTGIPRVPDDFVLTKEKFNEIFESEKIPPNFHGAYVYAYKERQQLPSDTKFRTPEGYLFEISEGARPISSIHTGTKSITILPDRTIIEYLNQEEPKVKLVSINNGTVTLTYGKDSITLQSNGWKVFERNYKAVKTLRP